MLLITALISYLANAKGGMVNKERTCKDYGGISRPDNNICCAASCGTCGGSGCSKRPGGASACCHGHIMRSGDVCGDQGRAAPCKILPSYNYVEYLGECEGSALTVEDHSKGMVDSNECLYKCNETPDCTGLFTESYGPIEDLTDEKGLVVMKCLIYRETVDADGHTNVLTGGNHAPNKWCHLRSTEEYWDRKLCLPSEECVSLASSRLPARVRYEPLALNNDLSFTAVFELDIPNPGSVFAYWDVGSCGPHGDDANWELCAGPTNSPQCQHTISTTMCPSGRANLHRVSGDGTKGSYTDTNGCSYFYSAEYKCEFKSLSWLFNWGQGEVGDFHFMMLPTGESHVGWWAADGSQSAYVRMAEYYGQRVRLAVVFDGQSHDMLSVLVDDGAFGGWKTQAKKQISRVQPLNRPVHVYTPGLFEKPKPTVHIGRVPYGWEGFGADWEGALYSFKLYARAFTSADFGITG